MAENAVLVGAKRSVQIGSLDSISFGVRRGNGPVLRAPLYHPGEELAALLGGQPWTQAKLLNFEWIAPSGQLHSAEFRYGQGWKGAWVGKPMTGQMEEGVWKVNVYDRERLLISGGFEVNARAPKLKP